MVHDDEERILGSALDDISELNPWRSSITIVLSAR